ncbi:MAG: efflux RND transporter periplasmic adaptor subunit [Bacteroidales bacterium]|jgi:Cu(I)/Ag(I) efflux system membrane fusion protein
MKKFIKNKYFHRTVIFLLGIFLGWLMFYKSTPPDNHTLLSSQNIGTIWTCAMHPQIRQDKPGKCPICGMDLIPLTQNSGSSGSNTIELSTDALQLANVQTTIVKRKKPEKEVRLYGRIEADERLIQTVPAHVPGRIEQLLVNFTGDEVVKGQTIAVIYSPTLIQAQQELLEAKKLANTLPGVLEAAREKLRQWKLTNSQISEIEKTEKLISNFAVKSTVSGVITKKIVNQGDYVSQGSALYEVSDLSKVWILFDAYESDLPWIKQGDKVQFILQSIPGKNFTANISFIAPVIDDFSRVAKVRIELANNSRIFKPGMFATGIVNAKLENFKDNIIIPRSAVLWTGKRSVVYVKIPDKQIPTFEMREIDLGPELGNSFVVLSGLQEGEELVTNGVFSLDAAAQLAGKTSMMNRNKETKNEVIPDFKNMTSANLANQLNLIFNAYILFKNRLVASDANGAFTEAQNLIKKIETTDMNLFSGASHEYWMTKSNLILTSLKEIKINSNVDEIRKSFVSTSENLIKVFKAFGTGKNKAYVQFCPMANQKIGAFWLSTEKQIRNPFYGNMMLTCGETRDTIN